MTGEGLTDEGVTHASTSESATGTDGSRPEAPSRPLVTLLRDRRFLLLWLGQTTSTVGHGVTVVALAMLLTRSHGGGVLGGVLAIDALATGLTLLVSGVVADRRSRTAVMAASDVLRFAGVLGFAALPDSTSFVPLALCAAAEGCGFALYAPAWRAALPQVVAEDRLQQAGALDALTRKGGLLLGGVIGGALVAIVGPHTALLVDAASYVVSLLTLLALRLPPVRAAEGEPAQGLRGVLHEAREGVRVVLAHRWAAWIMAQGTIQVLCCFGPAQVLLPLVSVDRWSPGAYGALVASQQVGMLAGSALGLRLRPRRPGVAAMHAIAAAGLLGVVIAVPMPLVLACGLVAVSWVGVALFSVLWFPALQRAFPAEVQGRVFSLEQLITFALDPVGLALAPWLAGWIGVTWVGLGGCLVLVVTSYAVLVVPGATRLADPQPDRALCPDPA